MITLHHLEISRSHRIIWLLEELGLKYEIKTYKRDPKSRLAPKAYLNVHPLGIAPVITDKDVTLGESGAIIEYILYKYGNKRLRPVEGSPEWIQYIYWLHYTEGTYMPLRIISLILDTVYKRSSFLVRPIVGAIRSKLTATFLGPRMSRQFHFIEAALAKHNWLAGDEFTAADIQLTVSLIWSQPHLRKMNNVPKILAYIERVKKRPAFIRTLEVGGPLEVTL